MFVAALRVGAADRADLSQARAWVGVSPAEVAERFARAATVEERVRWVRDADRVRPALESFFKAGPGAVEEVAAIASIGRVQANELTYDGYQVRLVGGGSRLLCVVVGGAGGGVDFDCYARRTSVAWEDLLSGAAVQAAEVRVFIESGNYYNHGFSDGLRWRNFTATTPDLGAALEFYAPRRSAVEQSLAELATFGRTRVTVAVRTRSGSHERRQFEVTKVLAPGWVVERRLSDQLSVSSQQ